MADEFSFLTDSEDERAVEDVLSQAMDDSVLEQLAAINCSSFSNSDNLPSHLETRFRKLKSLPTTTTTTTTAGGGSRFPPSKSKSLTPRSGDDSNVNESRREFCKPVDFKQIPDSPEDDSDKNRDVNKGTKSKSKSNSNSNSELGEQKSKTGTGSSKSRSDSWSLSSPESESGARRSPDEDSNGTRGLKKGTKSKPKSSSNTNSDSNSRKPKPKSKSGTSRSDSWTLSSSESESESGTLSPPRRSIGCLWCSTKKEKSVSRKQGKENRLSLSSSSLGNEYDYNHDVDFLKTFSVKEQKKIMKKAIKEEEKINREAEKIVKWAKQASSRMMDVSGLHDELSDFENTK